MLEETSFKLLIVEDDPGIATMLDTFFTSHTVNTRIAPDGREALKLVASFDPDIIILDIVLPYMDGLSVLDTLQKRAIQTPVILLTDKNSVEEKLQGFEHGADDYITKPFSPKELWMRVQAVLRRCTNTDPNQKQHILAVGGLSINPLTRETVSTAGTPLTLTKTEFDILYYLVERKGQAVSHALILEKVMGYSPTIETKALVIHIANIRKKFDLQGIRYLELVAVPGIGYKIVETSE